MKDITRDKMMLDELRHAFDTAYSSVKKYTTKTFTVFGAELTLLLFYMSSNEVQELKRLFEDTANGWYIFALIALVAFMTSAILFILTLATDRRWHFPPNEEKLLSGYQYQTITDERLTQELINEYNDNIAHCAKKVHRMKILSDTGTYILISGIACLLIIKIFGV